MARLLLGGFYLISGFNWVFGYVSFLPHIGMPEDLPMRHAVVAEMVYTGWMYQMAKIFEIVVGISLVINRFAPLMLTVTAPIAILTFGLGASLIVNDIWGLLTGTVAGSVVMTKIREGALGGLTVLLLHVWVMLSYFDYYRPMLTARALPREIQ